MVGKKLYAFGGESTVISHGLADTDIYDPTVEPCGWIDGPNMPQGERESMAAVALNGLIYVLGGYSCGGGTACTTDDVYAPVANAWLLPASPMPRPRYSHSAAAVGGKIYVFGGLPRAGYPYLVDPVDVYDPQTDTWAMLPDPMPTPRRGM